MPEPNALSDIDASLVTVGRPVEGGCAYTSFAASPALPTDATTKMSTLSDYVSLGELTTDGVTETKSVSTTDHKGWHGTVLLTSIDDETNTFKLSLVEVNRPAAMRLRYGDDAVTVGEDGTVSKVEAKPYQGVAHPLVIDELETNGTLRRTIVKKAVVTSFDDVSHQRGSLLAYGLTFTANTPDDGSAPIVIYRARPAQTPSTPDAAKVGAAKVGASKVSQ